MAYNKTERRRELRRTNPEWLRRDREYHAAYWRNRYRNDPEWRERIKADRRQRHADIMTDPEMRARKAAYAREWRAKRAMAKFDKMISALALATAYIHFLEASTFEESLERRKRLTEREKEFRIHMKGSAARIHSGRSSVEGEPEQQLKSISKSAVVKRK